MKTGRSATGSRAFTLIELLIVIAIIAILALIAVPNFLEAQVRAKVSRVYSDMRSLSTAIESYSIDYGTYPLCWNEFFVMASNSEPGWPKPAPSEGSVMSALTTPVAYITSMFRDPFQVHGALAPDGSNRPQQVCYWYRALRSSGLRFGIQNDMGQSVAYGKGLHWYLRTQGPSRIKANPEPSFGGLNLIFYMVFAGQQPLFIYDASNGTLSQGWIARTNQGQYKGVGWRKYP